MCETRREQPILLASANAERQQRTASAWSELPPTTFVGAKVQSVILGKDLKRRLSRLNPLRLVAIELHRADPEAVDDRSVEIDVPARASPEVAPIPDDAPVMCATLLFSSRLITVLPSE
jgi:hypothetical protein